MSRVTTISHNDDDDVSCHLFLTSVIVTKCPCDYLTTVTVKVTTKVTSNVTTAVTTKDQRIIFSRTQKNIYVWECMTCIIDDNDDDFISCQLSVVTT